MTTRRVVVAALLLLAAFGASADVGGVSLRGTGRALLGGLNSHARQLNTFTFEVVEVPVKSSKKAVKKVVAPKEVLVPTFIEHEPVKVKRARSTKKRDVQKVLSRTAKRIARADARVAHVIAATEATSKKRVAAAEVADSVAATAMHVDALTGPLILPALAAGAAVVSAKSKADAVINYNSQSAKRVARAIKKAQRAKAKAKKMAAKQIAAIHAHYAEQLSFDKVDYILSAGKAIKSAGKKAMSGIFLPPVLAAAPALGPQAIPYLLKGICDGAGPAPVLRMLSNFNEEATNALDELFVGDAASLLPASAAEHLVLPAGLPDFDLVKAVGQLKPMAHEALQSLVEGIAQPGEGGLPSPLPANLVRALVELNPSL